MSEALKLTWLRIFLRLVSVGYFAAFIPWITLILLKAPILAPGSSLAPLLRFQPYNSNYESMLTAIHIVWAAMLWRASGNPARHAMFIDFTIWASAGHGLVMLIATPVQKGFVMMLIEGLPLFGLAAVLWWLRPSAAVTSEGEMTRASERAHRRPRRAAWLVIRKGAGVEVIRPKRIRRLIRGPRRTRVWRSVGRAGFEVLK